MRQKKTQGAGRPPAKQVLTRAQEFLHMLAERIVDDIQPPSGVWKMTHNTDVTGAYAEQAVRELVRRYVSPLRVSSGSVVDVSNEPGECVPQLDTIIWAPCPVAAIYERGDFAVVPRGSSFGVLEIKSSGSNIDRIQEQISPEVVKHVTADTLSVEGGFFPGLGVICVLGRDHFAAFEKLPRGRVVALFHQNDGDGKLVPQTQDIYQLVNFLSNVGFRARKWLDSQAYVPVDLIPVRKRNPV
jgi:hypothetical protein